MKTIRDIVRLNILRLRNEKNLSQEKFGELVNLTKQQIYRIESGASFPPPETLARIADALDVTVEQLHSDPNSEIKAKFADISISIEQMKAIANTAIEAYKKETEKSYRSTRKEELLARITAALSAFDEDKLTVIAESYERRVAKKGVNSRRLKMGG